MKVTEAKRAIALVVLGVVGCVVVLVVLAAGLVQQRVTRGADPASAFTEVPASVPALEEVVVWVPDGPLQERIVEPATRRAVEATWTRAWHGLQQSAAGGTPTVDQWFSGPALDQTRAFISSNERPVGIRLGEHRLQVTFYSDDGSLLGLRADPVRVRRIIGSGPELRTLDTDETYDVVMLLEDGNWRIRQWKRLAAQPVDPA